MARIRTIKPEFWSDGTLMECSLNARLLFIGTWNFADDNGNLDRSAKQIKARIFPGDNIDCEPLIQELLQHGRLIEYSVNGSKYLHIHKFKEHQVINRPSKPHCPIYEPSLNTPGVIREDSGLKGREGKGEEGKGKEKEKTRAASRLRSLPDGFAISERVETWAKEKGYSLDLMPAHFEQFISYVKRKQPKYADWDEAFMTCVREDWGGVRTRRGAAPDYSGVIANLKD